MRLRQSLISLIAALSLMGSAVAASSTEAGNLAIQKTLLYTALLEKSPEGLRAEQINRAALDFAQELAAPSEFIALLQEAHSADESDEAIEKLNRRFDEILAQYKIEQKTLVALANNCNEPSESQIKMLVQERGASMLLSESESAQADFLAALPAEQGERESLAIKKSLLLYFLYAVENQSRISEEDAVKCAALALDEGAPRIYAHLLIASASHQLSPNVRYTINECFSKLLEAYRIDRDNLRAYAEVCGISSEQISGLMKEGKHHLSESFNLQLKTKEDASLSDIDSLSAGYLKDVRALAELLAGINKENAEQIDLSQLAALIPSYQATNSIIRGRDAIMYERLKEFGSNRLGYLGSALKITQQQLKRLFEQRDELPLALQALLIQFI